MASNGNCLFFEHGDNYEIMGWDGHDQHFYAVRVEKMGWFNDSNVLQVESSGIYTLKTMDIASNGVMTIKIPIKKYFTATAFSRSYAMTHNYIELHPSEEIPNRFDTTGESYHNAVFIRMHSVVADHAIPFLVDTFLGNAGDFYTDPNEALVIEVVDIA
jgi:hypothetical protein